MKFAFLSGLTWGLNAVVIGLVWLMMPFMDAPESAVAIPALHDLICAVLMLIIMTVMRRNRDTARALKTRAGWGVAIGGILGGPVGMTGYVIAIGLIGPAYTAIISSFYPALGTLLAFLFLKERMKFGQIVALLVAIGGIIAMSWGATDGGSNEGAVWGVLAALLCLVGWGSEAVIVAWALRNDSLDNMTALQIRETTSALTYAVVVLPIFGAFTFSFVAIPTPATGVIALAAIAGTLSYIFYYRAIGTIGASRSMALNISYAAWAVVFGLILLGQIPNVLTIVCCIVIFVGTVLAASSDWKALTNWTRRSSAKV